MKELKRPEQKDYFEYRGNQVIIDYGHATNFIDAQDDYIANLESERDKLKEEVRIWKGASELDEKTAMRQTTEIRKLEQELQTLKIEMRKYIYDKEDNYPKLEVLLTPKE